MKKCILIFLMSIVFIVTLSSTGTTTENTGETITYPKSNITFELSTGAETSKFDIGFSSVPVQLGSLPIHFKNAGLTLYPEMQSDGTVRGVVDPTQTGLYVYWIINALANTEIQLRPETALVHGTNNLGWTVSWTVNGVTSSVRFNANDQNKPPFKTVIKLPKLLEMKQIAGSVAISVVTDDLIGALADKSPYQGAIAMKIKVN